MNKIWHCDGLNIIQLLGEYTIIVKENELESNIDTIIQSDDMGKYINYLLRVAR